MCMGTSNWRAMAYSRSIPPTFSGVTLPFSFTSTPPRPQKAHRSKGFFKPARAMGWASSAHCCPVRRAPAARACRGERRT